MESAHDPSAAAGSLEDAPLSGEQQDQLLALARRSVAAAAAGQTVSMPDASELPPALREARACFVTLTEHGDLRGCIGTLTPQLPLHRAVAEMAASAAMHDPRFSPVRPDEVPNLELEISVLSPPVPIAFSSPDDLPGKLQAGRDGVVLHLGPLQATFLPQVWKDLPDKEDFLDHLSEKAGAPPRAWRGDNVRVEVYRVDSFEEPARSASHGHTSAG